MESNAEDPVVVARRTLLLCAAATLVPFCLLAYLAVVHVFPTLQEQGMALPIYSIMGLMLFSAVLSYFSYSAVKRDVRTLLLRIQNARQRLKDVCTAADEITLVTDAEKIGDVVAHQVSRVVKGRATLVWKLCEDGIRLVGSAGTKGDRVPITLEPGQGIAGRALSIGKPERDVHLGREDFAVDEALGTHTLHAMAVPLIVGKKARGVITVHNRLDGGRFTDSDLVAATVLARQSAQVMERVCPDGGGEG